MSRITPLLHTSNYRHLSASATLRVLLLLDLAQRRLGEAIAASATALAPLGGPINLVLRHAAPEICVLVSGREGSGVYEELFFRVAYISFSDRRQTRPRQSRG